MRIRDVSADVFCADLDLVGDLLDPNSEPAATGPAELTQLRCDAGSQLRGDREANADGSAGLREDRRVKADHVAVEIEQRTAGVAAVDRGIGLDEVVIGTLADIAASCRDDAGRHRPAEKIGRESCRERVCQYV